MTTSDRMNLTRVMVELVVLELVLDCFFFDAGFIQFEESRISGHNATFPVFL